MIFAKAAIATTVLFVSSMPAAAQSEQTAGFPVAPVWTVTPDEARATVEIAATAKDGTVRFVGECSSDPAQPGLVGGFSRYHGTGLRTDGQIEYVGFYVRSEDWQEAFSVQLRYSAQSRSWQIAKPLAPVFMSSFSRGSTLAVVNSHNEELFSFDLTGSTAATKTVRSVCKFA